jgi:hypothetical protein
MSNFSVRLAILASACAALTGCFFFVIPGSVTSSVSDAVTGAHGSNCVATTVKVGDRGRLPDGSIGVVKSLSGTSSRCTDPERPIRAEIVADTALSQASSTYASKLHLNLPADWVSQPLTDKQKTNGWSWYAVNKNIDAGVLFRSATHRGITDMATYVETRRVETKPEATDVALSEVSRVEVSGHSAFRYTVTGTQANGQRFTVLVTFVEGSDEIAQINTWTLAANFDHQRNTMEQLPDKIAGF